MIAQKLSPMGIRRQLLNHLKINLSRSLLISLLSVSYYCPHSHEGTTPGDTLRFDMFTSHSIKYIEVMKSLKGFFPTVLLSRIMAVLLHFQAIPMYLLIKSNYGFLT